ncbi:MAG: type II CAAX endopeptidase family protein [Bacteroidia bacterium]|nr:type II CAAX endopeptidase family protein [Bacteroidia bacterium]
MINRDRVTPLTILAVLGIFFLCMIASYIVTYSILGRPNSDGQYEYYPMVISQIIASIFSFGVPTIIVSAWKSRAPFDTLTDGKRVSPIAWILAIACITVCQPLVEWSTFVNEQLCMRMESWESMRAFSKLNNELYCSIMQHDTLVECCIMFLTMAILPAIVEEMFFRGTMQQILTATTRNPWVAIFTTASVFSLLHGDIVAFFPRMILGYILGVIYYFGKNIWVNIAAHAFNNSLAVILVLTSDGDILETLNKLQDNPGPVMPIIALALTILGIQGYIYRTRENRVETN